MIPGLQRYIGSAASPLIPFAVWLLAAILLSVPWTVAWTDRPAQYVWRVPLAFVATTIPPLGIIGFISPLTAAGYLFPSTGWAGLAAVALLPGILLAARGMAPRVRLAVACLAFATCGLLAISGRVRTTVEAETIPGWVGVNTHFGDCLATFPRLRRSHLHSAEGRGVTGPCPDLSGVHRSALVRSDRGVLAPDSR